MPDADAAGSVPTAGAGSVLAAEELLADIFGAGEFKFAEFTDGVFLDASDLLFS